MEHVPELIKLARHPNVAVKATGAPGYCSGPYPFKSMHPYLRQIYDAFGPARMFWGTDDYKDAVLLAAVRHHVHRGVAMVDRAG